MQFVLAEQDFAIKHAKIVPKLVWVNLKNTAIFHGDFILFRILILFRIQASSHQGWRLLSTTT